MQRVFSIKEILHLQKRKLKKHCNWTSDVFRHDRLVESNTSQPQLQ